MSETNIRISYADTDQMGMVYYANYLVFFERGRTEWLRETGLEYKELEQQGVYLPVSECSCQYIFPARYDDVITIRTTIAKLGFASIEFCYELLCDGKTVATGRTKHPFVNRERKPVRIPNKIRAVLETKDV